MVYAIFLCYQMTGSCQLAPNFEHLRPDGMGLTPYYTSKAECQRAAESVPGNRPGIPTQGIDWRCMGRETGPQWQAIR